MEIIEMTLAYLIQDKEEDIENDIDKGKKILLPLKKKKIGKNTYSGVGGKLENNETHEEAMLREFTQEVGLTPTVYTYMGKVAFNSTAKNELRIVHMYICESSIGELVETDEMKPFWFDIDKIPYDKSMYDVKFWLPLILGGNYIDGSFVFDADNNITKYAIDTYEPIKKGKVKSLRL